VILEDGVRAGDSPSRVKMGDRMIRGDGVPENVSEGLNLWAQAALEDYPEAMIRLAGVFEKGDLLPRDPVRAMALWVRAAKAGSPEALLRVADARFSGQGLAPDPAEGLRLVIEAASKDDPEALRRLAWHLEKGAHIRRDLWRAIELYRRAARGGHAAAQNDLAVILALRNNLNDRVEAWSWFMCATEQGVPEAKDNRKALEKKMSSQERREARRLYAQLVEEIKRPHP
ncbi:MAG: tetratricopeptide repeat protein, partial [Kiritimatiellia bacterium]|nr:tetratricopeptide repeat protein [Kiritimatiellia bacterium]